MNKYKILIIAMFFLSIFTISKVDALVKDLPLLGKIIYLDAGHGGKDCGAIAGTTYEKDLNLALTKKIAQKLGEKGAIVLLTRVDDNDLASPNIANRKRSDLTNRAMLINKSKANMYISIHMNSTTNSTWRGLQIFYNSNNPNNINLATIMNDTIKKEMSTVREVKKVNDYYMYKQIKKTGILIEAGFLSNPSDLYLLKQDSYQEELSNLITKGIINYYN